MDVLHLLLEAATHPLVVLHLPPTGTGQHGFNPDHLPDVVRQGRQVHRGADLIDDSTQGAGCNAVRCKAQQRGQVLVLGSSLAALQALAVDTDLFDDFVNAKGDQRIAVVRKGFHAGDDPSIAQQLTTVSTQQVHLPL